jgi:uncharacterized iron-regulated membrane protein
MTQAFWRQWHRWIGFPAALFLLWAGTTGAIIGFTEFFGEEEALREATRDLISPVKIGSATSAWTDPISRAVASAATLAPGAPVDQVILQFKGDNPTVSIFTGKPTGGEDRKLVFNAKTGALVSNESYADKPLINRLHSGEAFGDGGLVFAMLWGASLVTLTLTGLIIYWRMRRRNAKGITRFFW